MTTHASMVVRNERMINLLLSQAAPETWDNNSSVHAEWMLGSLQFQRAFLQERLSGPRNSYLLYLKKKKRNLARRWRRCSSSF